jgi:hypothetical protein
LSFFPNGTALGWGFCCFFNIFISVWAMQVATGDS